MNAAEEYRQWKETATPGQIRDCDSHFFGCALAIVGSREKVTVADLEDGMRRAMAAADRFAPHGAEELLGLRSFRRLE